MGQPFASHAVAGNATASSPKGFAITPDDNADLSDHIRALTINASGVVAYVAWDGTACTTGTLPAGTYPLLAKRVKSTGTTATGLTGWV